MSDMRERLLQSDSSEDEGENNNPPNTEATSGNENTEATPGNENTEASASTSYIEEPQQSDASYEQPKEIIQRDGNTVNKYSQGRAIDAEQLSIHEAAVVQSIMNFMDYEDEDSQFSCSQYDELLMAHISEAAEDSGSAGGICGSSTVGTERSDPTGTVLGSPCNSDDDGLTKNPAYSEGSSSSYSSGNQGGNEYLSDKSNDDSESSIVDEILSSMMVNSSDSGSGRDGNGQAQNKHMTDDKKKTEGISGNIDKVRKMLEDAKRRTDQASKTPPLRPASEPPTPAELRKQMQDELNYEWSRRDAFSKIKWTRVPDNSSLTDVPFKTREKSLGELGERIRQLSSAMWIPPRLLPNYDDSSDEEDPTPPQNKNKYVCQKRNNFNRTLFRATTIISKDEIRVIIKILLEKCRIMTILMTN